MDRIFRANPFRPARCVELRGATVLRPRDEGLVPASVVAVILGDWWRGRAARRGA